MVKRINEEFDSKSLNLEDLMNLVTSNLNLLSRKFSEREPNVDESFSTKESWAFRKLDDAVTYFCSHYCHH